MKQRARPLRVAMDVQCLETAKTGIRTYVESLMREFARPDQPHVVVPLHGPHLLPTDKRTNRLINQALRVYWWQIWLPLRLLFGRFDLLFSPDIQTPGWSPVPHVVTVHDATTARRPEDYNRFWHVMFRRVMLPQIRRARAIITVSHFSAGEIVTYMGLDPNRIRVIPLGGPAPEQFTRVTEAQAQAILARFGITAWSYVLHMGVLEHRKNLVTLVKAFHLWQQQDGFTDFKLVLAGPSPNQPNLDATAAIRQTIADLGMADRVVLCGLVSDDERAALYTHAAVVAVPSILEGFGIPLLDAFAAHVPLIAANATSLPEVAGDAALLFDPQSPPDIAAQLTRLAHDPGLRASLVQMGEAQLRAFDWRKTTAATMTVFASAASRTPPAITRPRQVATTTQ